MNETHNVGAGTPFLYICVSDISAKKHVLPISDSRRKQTVMYSKIMWHDAREPE
jgi:hypothetical protein